MMAWHGYILISELPPGWTSSERNTAFAALRGLGKQSDPQPAKITHSRLSLDGRRIILESEWQEAEIARANIVAVMTQALGVQSNAVDAKINYSIFAESGTWQESRDAAAAWIAARIENWQVNE